MRVCRANYQQPPIILGWLEFPCRVCCLKRLSWRRDSSNPTNPCWMKRINYLKNKVKFKLHSRLGINFAALIKKRVIFNEPAE